MNDRQRKFCQYYAENPNGTEAARKAGYSERTAASIASENLRKPEILKYIRSLQDEQAEIRIATLKQIKATLSDILNDTDAKDSDRVAAGNVLLKAAGAFLHFKPDPETEWRIAAGEAGGEDVIIYLPQLEKTEDAEMPEEETEDD